jgi:hypothetical protein
MEYNHHQVGVIKNYTGTALLSFCIMFFLFVSLSRCKGPYEPSAAHHSKAATTQEHHGASEHQKAEEHH